jgi:hypothetical protein
MTSSIDWTSPAAYSGRVIPAPRKRGLAAELILKLRIQIRSQQREQQRLREVRAMYRLGRHLPDTIRKDIGLPPYHS